MWELGTCPIRTTCLDVHTSGESSPGRIIQADNSEHLLFMGTKKVSLPARFWSLTWEVRG